MKRCFSVLFALFLVVFTVSSCKSEYSEFDGAWYYDEGGQRDAIQFSTNDAGKEVFIWAKYDIENDTVLSISKGYFTISNSTITLDFITSDIDLTLNYTFDGDKLTLSSETASLVLTKKVIDE